MEQLDQAIDAAMKRGEEAARHEPRAASVRYDRERKRLTIVLLNGTEITMAPAILGLSEDADLSGARVEGGGYDLYFPAIDEGAYVPEICRAAVDAKRAA